MTALVFSIIVIFVAHLVRVFRWQQLIMTYEKPDTERLMKALSLGYFFNFFVPFKLGEFVRALYAGTKMKNGRGFALATVIVERCLDVISVGIIFIIIRAAGLIGAYNGADMLLSTPDNDSSLKNRIFGILGIKSTAGYYIVLAVGLFAVIALVYISRDRWKKYLFRLASMLNVTMEERLLRFFWALIWGFKDILYKLPKLRLVLYTIFMWALYLLSYGLFAVFLTNSGVNRTFTDVFYSLFAQSSLLASGFSISTQTLMYALFLLLPVFILLIAARIVPKSSDGGEETLNLLPHTNPDERRTFLELYFSGENKTYINNYLKINRNILVLRDCSAGSNATTILCTDGENSFYRKYAFADAGIKLGEQIEWLEKNTGRLPLTRIIHKDINDDACFYDMPYKNDAVTMFEYIHGAAKEKAWDTIVKVLQSLEGSLYCDKKSIGIQEKNKIVDSYIGNKFLKNISLIRDSKELKDILKYESIVINGKKYDNLPAYTGVLDKEKLFEVFSDDEISEIHGDLTIENIICEDDDFYLIDPNTGNILDSKFIDYAKLLQSLHGKYEYLQSVKSITVNGNEIEFNIVKSEAYDYLYDKYKEYLHEHFGSREIRSIYYHEICNFLRLMPYKIKKGRGLVFYAGLIMILEDISKL